jgi:hypothetical protein
MQRTRCLIAAVLLPVAAAQDPLAEPVLLEMRPVATAAYDEAGARFDLDAERARLEQWLALGENRAMVRERPEKIRLFNWLAASRGGPLQPQLRWYPYLVRPAKDGKSWDFSFSRHHRGVTAVPVFDETEFAADPKASDSRLVELLAVNMHAPRFSQDDLDPGSIKAGVGPDDGRPAVYYAIKPDRAAAFGEFSERFVRQSLAIIVDDIVVSAPIIMSRLPAQGVIVGGFSREAADRLAAGLIASVAPRPSSAATSVSGGEASAVPAGADPADLRAMQGAQAMLAAEQRLRDMVRAGKIAGIDRILSFEEISSWPYEDGIKGMPEQLESLNGRNVLMTGFMLPIDEVENIKEFLLVQSLWSCCYGQPPDINGIVRVVMKGNARLDYQFDPLKVVGTFRIGATFEDGYCVDIYQLEADSVEVIK